MRGVRVAVGAPVSQSVLGHFISRYIVQDNTPNFSRVGPGRSNLQTIHVSVYIRCIYRRCGYMEELPTYNLLIFRSATDERPSLFGLGDMPVMHGWRNNNTSVSKINQRSLP